MSSRIWHAPKSCSVSALNLFQMVIQHYLWKTTFFLTLAASSSFSPSAFLWDPCPYLSNELIILAANPWKPGRSVSDVIPGQCVGGQLAQAASQLAPGSDRSCLSRGDCQVFCECTCALKSSDCGAGAQFWVDRKYYTFCLDLMYAVYMVCILCAYLQCSCCVLAWEHDSCALVGVVQYLMAGRLKQVL